MAEIQRNWNRCTSKYKSTLIRTLLGHVARRDGHITLFGKDASRFKPHEVSRLGVGYVPEGRGVFQGGFKYEVQRFETGLGQE